MICRTDEFGRDLAAVNQATYVSRWPTTHPCMIVYPIRSEPTKLRLAAHEIPSGCSELWYGDVPFG